MSDASAPPKTRRAPALRPRDAATLIIVDRSGSALRVLMGKRHPGHKFMPGKYVFPGGRLEAEDRRMAAAGALDPSVEAKLNLRVRRPSPGFARAIALSAIRETFEETGVVIGVAGYGGPDLPPPGAWRRFADTGVYPTLEGVDFLARAITPPGRPRRFDARFLVVDASLIAKQVGGVVHPEAELVDLVWTRTRQGARTRPAEYHPYGAGRTGCCARGRARPSSSPPLLSRVAGQATEGRVVAGWRDGPLILQYN